MFNNLRSFKITTLHGANIFAHKKGCNLITWSTILLCNFLITVTFILVIRTRYNNDQIVTRVEAVQRRAVRIVDDPDHTNGIEPLSLRRDFAFLCVFYQLYNGEYSKEFFDMIPTATFYTTETQTGLRVHLMVNANCKVNQVPFPAVSICNFNMVSLKHINTITKILKNHNQRQHKIDMFFRNLYILKDFGKTSNEVGNYSKIMEILKQHYFTVETIMEEVHQKCEDLLLYCSFNGRKKNCNDIFNMIKTYNGHCCTFNYAGLNDGSIDQMPNDNDIEYYIDPSDDGNKKSTIIVTSESGRGSGLSVLFNVEPKDYPSWSVVPCYGAKILISDPNDYPETKMLYKYLVTGESLDIKVEPKIFQSDEDIRRVSIEKRGCIFHDEAKLEYTNRFSTETCKTECKMKNYEAHCGCIPYKYPREKGSRICDFEDVVCLNDLRARSNVGDESCDPVCHMECLEKNYSITSDIMPLLPDIFPSNVIQDRNISELSSLHVYFTKSTCNCYKKMMLIDFNYFIATYGGVFSLSFGASIITLFEIVYLLVNKLLGIFFKSV